MKKVSIRQASRPLGQYASELKDEIVLVTEGRRAVAALVPLKNVDRESLALSSHPEFLDLVRRARAEIASGATLSLTKIKSQTLRRHPPKRLQPPARSRRGG
ncbi:MAG: hypothetical protein AB1486_14570 [Planctomycetota bacterium]